MNFDEIFLHPFNDVVLERPFNNLMQDVGGQKLVNVGPGKICSEWLYIIT